ncbi:MAG: ornithine cyclodeaminase family protein [Rhodospirillaceae bacterium]|nr:ornithine cyclodeaminase family protein [Rhodospirillaceae bacterium]
MIVISEKLARELVTVEDAIGEVEKTFAAMAKGTARNYPVVREVVGFQDAVYGVKTGCDVAAPILGLKAGGYWPHNAQKGLTNHQSSTLLFDPETGMASALVSANYLTGVRTGASSAIATKYLSRQDSSELGIIGTGVQAGYQLRATLAVRPITTVRAWDPSAENLKIFGKTVSELGLKYIPESDREAVVKNSDILITVTPSQSSLVEKEWVRPGTHISAMGADTKGKQELDPKLVADSVLFVDEAGQAISIGEFQHAFSGGMINEKSFRGSIGQVIAGMCDGRRSDEEITIFDGTGVSLQDLVVAELAVRQARLAGKGAEVDY